MKRFALFAAAVGLVLPVLATAPAHAQATRTWVSGVGNDANPCSRTAPCKTFAGAISKTAINGEINCIDPGGYGAVTITKSITIDCTGTFGSILASFVNGVVINATGSGGTDPLRIVRLRGITINGSGSSNRAGIRGVSIVSALEVHLDNVVIDNFVQQAVGDVRTGAGKLFVTNSNFRNNGVGMGMAPTSGTLNVSVDGTAIEGNGIGIAAASNVNVVISRSVISGNSTNGIDAQGGQMAVMNSTISSNNVGVQVSSGTVRLYDNSIMFNTTAAISGATTSFGLNRIVGTSGTSPSPAGAATDALGTQ
ncbi:hypothetical protein J6500_07205 [Bradyrhizobium sp. WSM 1704]|uniref:hypothetical protein n=1 Tax=Bradyrhizobium semiaridum TaxID=2821404 RepID=UPI001CE31A59|nr:hypothetical protein [Bradyrhizobium semiaridum]MCA6121688.1 hypothetical protein [Bradyrhizobium semiaridum]